MSGVTNRQQGGHTEHHTVSEWICQFCVFDTVYLFVYWGIANTFHGAVFGHPVQQRNAVQLAHTTAHDNINNDNSMHSVKSTRMK